MGASRINRARYAASQNAVPRPPPWLRKDQKIPWSDGDRLLIVSNWPGAALAPVGYHGHEWDNLPAPDTLTRQPAVGDWPARPLSCLTTQYAAAAIGK